MPGQQLPCSITEPGGRGRTGHNRSAPAPALGSVSARGAARGGGVGGRFLHYSLHDHFVTPAPQEGNAKRCLSKCSGSQTLILFLRQERQLIRVRFADTPNLEGRQGGGRALGGRDRLQAQLWGCSSPRLWSPCTCPQAGLAVGGFTEIKVRTNPFPPTPGQEVLLSASSVPASTPLFLDITPPPLFSSLFLHPFIISPSSYFKAQDVQNNLRISAASWLRNKTFSWGLQVMCKG